MSISLKELKKNRLTPAEKYVLDLIESVESQPDIYGNVDWYKDDKWLFEQDFKKGRMLVSWYRIWLVLEQDFGLNNGEIQGLIKNVMYEYTNNGELTPCYVQG